MDEEKKFFLKKFLGELFQGHPVLAHKGPLIGTECLYIS